MNVGELKEALDDYGDHVPVAIVVNRGEAGKVFTDFEVDSSNRLGMSTVILEVDW
jgi:hypothetical protein